MVVTYGGYAGLFTLKMVLEAIIISSVTTPVKEEKLPMKTE